MIIFKLYKIIIKITSKYKVDVISHSSICIIFITFILINNYRKRLQNHCLMALIEVYSCL